MANIIGCERRPLQPWPSACTVISRANHDVRVRDVSRSAGGQKHRAPDLLAGAFAVAAPRPAARPTLALLKLLPRSANAAFSSHLLPGILDPADELVAGQRRDVVPGIERRRVGDQSFAQVFRKFVHHPTGHYLAAHKTMVAAILDAREASRLARPRGWFRDAVAPTCRATTRGPASTPAYSSRENSGLFRKAKPPIRAAPAG